MSKRRLYEAMPRFLRTSLKAIPLPLAAGRPYRRVRSARVRFDRMDREQLLAFQEAELADLLSFACEQVPIYRDLRGTVGRLRPFEALKAFPLVDKNSLQENFERHIPEAIDRIPHYECSTGGTSGNQLRFYLDSEAQAEELGFIHRMWERVGFSPGDRKATFRGVPFPDLADGVYWQSNPIYREIQFSPFHMSEGVLDRYLAKLRQFRPKFLHGYPSALALLGGFVQRHRIDLSDLGLKAVLLGSEGLYPGQRELLESAFHCRAFSWYGHSEQAVLGGECELSTTYHQFPDYGIVEMIADSGCAISEGERGELVGTSLRNRSLPFIRYRTDDFARRLSHRCECGRNFDRFDEVEGHRGQDLVVGSQGARMSLAALNMHGAMFDEVVRYQYHQRVAGEMEIQLMVTSGFGPPDAALLQRAFEDKVGPELRITLRVVDDIPLTAAGKLRLLVQEISAEERGAIEVTT